MKDLSSQPEPPTTGELTDRDLLRRFIRESDEIAFTEIVKRHHGLVMSVCRRVTGRPTDADDAFQATFLVLARRPRSIRRAETLSSWLYTVAWRTSWRLVKRRSKLPMDALSQEPALEPPGPLEQIASAQNLLVLDEELNELPAKYRDVLVMTYFADQSNQQVADHLDVSRGTVDGRLRRGRNMLRVRLARRGVSLGVVGIAAGLLTEASAATSPDLLASTTALGIQTLGGAVPPSTELSHLEPLIRPETAMISTKLLTTGIVCAGVIAGGLGLYGLGEGAAQDAAPGTVLQGDVSSAEKDGNGDAAPIVVVASDPNESLARDEQPVDSVGGDGAESQSAVNYEYWPEDAKPVEKWMYELLDEPVPRLDYPQDTPVQEILEFVAAYFTDTHGAPGHRLNMWTDSTILDDRGFESLADVAITHDVYLEGQTLRNALKLILSKTEPVLTCVIRDEVMVITSDELANSDDYLETRTYPVGHLLAVQPAPSRKWVPGSSDAGGVGQGFFSTEDDDSAPPAAKENPPNEALGSVVLAPETPAGKLIEVVMEMTSPPFEWVDSDGSGGTIEIFGDSLVVRQTPPCHEEIVRLLNMLSNTMKADQ